MTRPTSPHAIVFVAVTVLLDVIGFSLIMPVLPSLLVGLTCASVNQRPSTRVALLHVRDQAVPVRADPRQPLSDRFGRRRCC